MSKYCFYYDESEHSRKINYKTICASNYYDNCITMIVGWEDKYDGVLHSFAEFENTYAYRRDQNGEIKSTTINQKQFAHGFASLNKENAQLVNDFLSIFDKETHIYFSVFSKIEHLVLQLFKEYRNWFNFDSDLMKYSIIKALVTYRPYEVIECVFKSPDEFLQRLKDFFRERIENNKKNPLLKECETGAFEEILCVLNSISEAPKLEWNYQVSFEGFNRYLKEKNITSYSLTLDKEGCSGEDSDTLKAAYAAGLKNVDEADSVDCPGVRIADMLAGIISKLLKGLADSLRAPSNTERLNKTILKPDWFKLNEIQLGLYKKLYRLICVWQPAWYKSYAGIFSDDLVVFIALLNFMNHFDSIDQIQLDINMQGEYFNSFAVEQLKEYFTLRRCKLPIDPIIQFDNESFLNQRCAKEFFDIKKQKLLPIHEGYQTYYVLSVAVDKEMNPSLTIQKDGKSVCFRLPEEFREWACTVVSIAALCENFFPAKVIFSLIDGKYYADILED